MSIHVMTVTALTKSGVVDVTADTNVEAGNVATDIYLPNDGQTLFVTSAVTGDTWTFTAIADKFGRTETLTLVVASGKFAMAGPFLPELWNDADGYIHIVPTVGNAGDFILAVRAANPS